MKSLLISGISLTVTGVALLSSCSQKQKQEKNNNVQQPNILILFADDMGYADLNCYGGKAQSPHLDQLAENGIKFTNFYAAAPNCSPSRVGLLTGRIPARAGMFSYRNGGLKHTMHLKDEEITLAELLKENGYQTAHFGKWHLGCLPQDSNLNQAQPDDQGFDYSLGTENNARPSHFNPVNFVRNGKELGEVKGYSCQIVADEITSWFDTVYDSSKPFFQFVAFHEPHQKIASPPELIKNYPDENEFDAKYFANIQNLDSAAGRILKKVKDLGLLDNTLVIFASDNGPYRQGSQGSLRGLKGEVWDGGIKVPGIIHWPQQFGNPKVIDKPVWLEDIFPTICEINEIEMPENKTIDGVSLLPLIENGKLERTTPMFWYFYRSHPEVAMRIGDFNLVGYTNDSVPRTHYVADQDMHFIKTARPDSFLLFNLAKDPEQQKIVNDEYPEKYSEMKQKMLDLLSEIQKEAPVWEGLPEYTPDHARRKTGYIRD